MAATLDRAIDAHAHVFSADAPAVAGARYRPAYGANVNEWRGLWERAGITHGVVVQPSFFGTDNREMLDTIASDPKHVHFGGGQTEAMVTLPPGQHTLQLVLGDWSHIPHVPPVMSTPITVTVK